MQDGEAGAAIWMPMRVPMPGSRVTERASSISVVGVVDGKSRTSARGGRLAKPGLPEQEIRCREELFNQEAAVVR